jgi:hypothetical protein
MSSASDDRLRLLVDRVVESRYFSKSARLRDMLQYLSGRVLRDGASEIHEQEVGREVFGRASDYDTASDNTVRVHASTLRKRLEQYFANEGAAEPMVIELPKGNYALTFRERSAPPKVEEPALVLPAQPGKNRAVWALAAVAIAFAGTTIWLAVQRPGSTPAPLMTGKPTVSELWTSVFRPGQPSSIVLDDAAIGLYQEQTGRTVRLSEYYDRGYLLGLDPSMSQLVLKRYSSFANVNILGRLWQIAGPDIKLVFARDYSFQALRNDNPVLLGNSRVNPWVEPFEAAIGVRWQFDAGSQSYFPVDSRAASPEAFRPSSEKRDAPDGYALVAMLPNLQGSGRVLLLSATGGSALSTAIEFLTDEPSVRRLRSQLGGSTGSGEGFGWFEALLKVNGRSRRPEEVSLAICRPVTSKPTNAPQ